MHVRSFKIIHRPESEKIIIEKDVEEEVKHGILYATRELNYLPPQSLFCKAKGCFTLHLAKFIGN